MNPNNERVDVYERVTSQIVAAIEAGSIGNWKMPWHTSGKYVFSPINVAGKKPYRGINTVCLWAAAQRGGYERGEWGTYNQWQDLGAQVRKGEKATTVCFWKFASGATETQDGEEQSTASSRLLFTRGYSVFNVSQVDGYTPKGDSETPVENRIAQADEFFGAVPARVVHLGNRAYYSPSEDSITLPPFSAFHTPVDYYSTRAHETGHWTSKDTRCDRKLGKRFGDMAYAVEELVAELSAAFTCSYLGLENTPRVDHAQYLASWLRVLKSDAKAIFTAASKAQAATDYILKEAEKSKSIN